MLYNFQGLTPVEPTGIIELRDLPVTGKTDLILATRKQILWQLNEYLSYESEETFERLAKELADEVNLWLKYSPFTFILSLLVSLIKTYIFLSVSCLHFGTSDSLFHCWSLICASSSAIVFLSCSISAFLLLTVSSLSLFEFRKTIS